MNFTETQEMDRGDEVEVIYANANILNDDLRTGMEDSDAKRFRTLHCTGIQTRYDNEHYHIQRTFSEL